jgi:hypothetical protein
MSLILVNGIPTFCILGQQHWSHLDFFLYFVSPIFLMLCFYHWNLCLP